MVTKRPTRAPLAAKRARKAKPLKPLGQILANLGKKIPADEMAKMPRDGAANHDHYIYGTPKQY
jgi:hypothetical protein